MKILEILRRKGWEVVTITEDRSVLDAARKLVEHNIGGLVVTEGSHPVGIITERDILRLTAESPERLAQVEVGAVMTRELIVAEPEDKLRHSMGVMTRRKVRHLPVIDGRELVGIVSIGDLVHTCLELADDENVHLRRYIHGMS